MIYNLHIFGTRIYRVGFFLVFLSAQLSVVGCGGGGASGSSTDSSGTGGTSGTTSSGSLPYNTRLTWDSPTTYEDGSCLNDLAGYTIHYGNSGGTYDRQKVISTSATTCVDSGAITSCGRVQTCTYTLNESDNYRYFAVTAHNVNGVSSLLSNEASKTIN